MIKNKNKNFYILIYVFFLINLFVSLVFNLTEYREKLKNKNIIQIELSDKLEKERITEIEKNVIGIKGVISTRFYSKEESLEKITKELNISIASNNNPISDILICYIDPEKGNLKSVVAELEKEKDTTGIYYDEKKINFNIEDLKNLKTIIVMNVIVILIPLILTVFSLYKDMIYNYSLYFYLVSKDKEKAEKRAKKVSFLPMVASNIIGSCLYFGIYMGLYKTVFQGNIISVQQFFQIVLKVNIVLILLVGFIPKRIFEK
ncbi:MAG: permease-like cell division protein FtsX [Fusobacteriaceae bacterium]